MYFSFSNTFTYKEWGGVEGVGGGVGVGFYL